MKNKTTTRTPNSRYPFRNVKTVFGPIAIYYCLVSSFLAFVISYFSLMAFSDRDSSLVLCTILNIIFFTILFRVNNHFAERDNRTIDHLFVSKKYDTSKFIFEFYSDLREVFSRNGQPYSGYIPDIAMIAKVNLGQLFSEVFMERAGAQFDHFINVGGNFMEFIDKMDAESKEVLFRHYLR